MTRKIGIKFEMAWPFYIVKGIFGGDDFWCSGCKVEFIQYDQGCGERFFNADAEGKVIYEMLSVAKMPKPMIDRIVFRRTLVDPDGVRHGKAKVMVLTMSLFKKHIGKHSPFNADYELPYEHD